MSRNIHIEKLEIRTKNVSRAAARTIGLNIGGEILRRAAENMPQRPGTRRIEKINAGRIESRGGNVSEIQNRIASSIADLIGKRMDI